MQLARLPLLTAPNNVKKLSNSPQLHL